MEYIWRQMKTEKEIISQAKAYAEQQGWAWLGRCEIVQVPSKENGSLWKVRTNCDAIGCNIEMELNAASGEILTSSYRPR